MAVSSTDLQDVAYGARHSIVKSQARVQERPTLATRFKCLKNFPTKDIEAIRRLLELDRAEQDDEAAEFWISDFQRMMFDDWLVSRFLMRGLKASQKKQAEKCCQADLYLTTMDLIRNCAKFRFDYRVNGDTRLEEFLIEWTSREGLLNDKPDLLGNPTIYLRVKLHKPSMIETRELRHQFKRLLLFTLEKSDRELENKPGKGICCIFDMSDATFENVDLELVGWIIKSFKNCSPKLLSYGIVYNLPWFFSATFKLISNTLMSSSHKNSLRFVYGDEILSYIDYSNLPQYIRNKL